MRNTSKIGLVHRAAARLARSVRRHTGLFGASVMLGLASGPVLGGDLPTQGTFNTSFGSGSIINHPNGLSQTVWLNGSTALINWNTFNIGAGHNVHFQSTAGSNFAVLNKTNQGTPSQIHGQLTGSGAIGLINPAGVVFFGSSVVDVGSFLAASGSLVDEAAFLNSSPDGFVMKGASGSINILPGASITANNDLVLLGRTVTNRGSLTAPTIVMAGGIGNDDEVTVKKLGDVISLRINDDDLNTDTEAVDDFYKPDSGNQSPTHIGSRSVVNDGEINGTRHIVLANGGRIDAVACTGLVRNEGTIKSTADQGGTVRVAAPAIINMSGGSIAADTDTNDGNAGEVFLHSNVATILQTDSQISTNARLTGNSGFITSQSDGV
ncbi:MAG: filamentous hemagglutinin N-terminal domain-containing protein, partial [Phycisphaerales bacterium]|nr:filamentous hemagglutinin N-terminal domain-containing protein [Phycisphaerales bacterium]